MRVVNADAASDYLDSLTDERERSAAMAIHLTWLDHSSTLCRGKRLEPCADLDMLILYKAAVATFQEWPPTPPDEWNFAQSDYVLNGDKAQKRLSFVRDEGIAALATRFAQEVEALSAEMDTKQDLDYYVNLFLRRVTQEQAVENIVLGALSRHSDALDDPDLW